MSAEKALPSSS